MNKSKKPTSRPALQLSRATVRTLSSAELTEVAAAVNAPFTFGNLPTGCTCPIL